MNVVYAVADAHALLWFGAMDPRLGTGAKRALEYLEGGGGGAELKSSKLAVVPTP